MPVPGKPDKAQCNVCNKELSAVVTALKKHGETSTHKERMSALTDPSVKKITTMLVDRSMEGSVQEAEMRMAGFLSEHNLSFKLMDHFSA